MRDHKASLAVGDRDAPPETSTTPVPPEPSLPPELLTPQEVAARLKCSRATVYKLIHEAKLPVLRVGNGFRIDWSRAYAQMSQPDAARPVEDSVP